MVAPGRAPLSGLVEADETEIPAAYQGRSGSPAAAARPRARCSSPARSRSKTTRPHAFVWPLSHSSQLMSAKAQMAPNNSATMKPGRFAGRMPEKALVEAHNRHGGVGERRGGREPIGGRDVEPDQPRHGRLFKGMLAEIVPTSPNVATYSANHFADRLLLGLMRDPLAALAAGSRTAESCHRDTGVSPLDRP